ncbi:TRAP transporter permease [Vineibacter terrae]|uniref:TRAP transporter permease n=1 Tax=Vineibacter terrae TaxID=2586908 RepID=A0A5C8P9Z5_9HYPH|nr:TRAP transporter permease [Vineibacter terrae]TXL69816.1 TRAP transporter permease [Vineibacter terrae]
MAEAQKVVLDDPHVQTGPAEAETTRVRTLRGPWRMALIALTGITVFLCINQQFGLRFFVGFTPLNSEYFYLLILCMLPFTFLIFPGGGRAPVDHLPWYDIVLFVATAAASLYLMLHIRKAAELGWEFGGAPAGVTWTGYVMWFVLMEALRRTGGWSLMLSVLPFTVYPLFAEARWLGPLKGNQSTWEQASAYHMLSTESLLGIPIQAFADTVIGFLVFGTALMMTGAGKFFINLSFALCGTFRGGAAKVCIFASGLLGMMSGSIVSNVLTAGTMTIPVMKRTGFRPSYAGAIEACASTGAVLAPPVMGATAFVMAQFMGVTYAEVAMAAVIPALLYYAGLFMQVDSYAARHGLKGLPRSELPRAWDAIKDGWYYAFVIILLIVMLLYFKRESHAPFYATALLLVLNQWAQPGAWRPANTANCLAALAATVAMVLASDGYAKAAALPAGAEGAGDAWMNAVLLPTLGGLLVLVVLNELFGGKRWGLAKYLAFLEVNGRTFVELIGILAGCGLLIGAFSMTGVISSLANDLLALAGNNAILLLVMCAVTSLVLGLGLTTTACYIFLAILVGPALEKAGLNKMAVHMFIFYWGMLSSITPPVAIASFAAAGIAGAPAMKTGWESMWVGSIIYFIPFFFVLNPAFVLQGSWSEALYLTLAAGLGTLFICGGIQGYQAGIGDLRGAGMLEWPLRVLLVLGGLVFATPGDGIMPLSNTVMDVLGLAILVPAVLLALWLVRRAAPHRAAQV